MKNEQILDQIIIDISKIGAELLDCKYDSEVSPAMYAIYENRIPDGLRETAIDATKCGDIDDMSNLIYLFCEDGLIQIRDAQYIAMENAQELQS